MDCPARDDLSIYGATWLRFAVALYCDGVLLPLVLVAIARLDAPPSILADVTVEQIETYVVLPSNVFVVAESRIPFRKSHIHIA